MANRRKRCDIDYSTFHKTGVKVPINRSEEDAETTEDNMTEAAVADNADNVNLLVQAEEICDEALSDFFEENVLTDAYSFEEIDG